MNNHVIRSFLTAVLVFSASGGLGACAIDSSESGKPSVPMGSLQLPLLAQVDGRTYRVSLDMLIWPEGFWITTGNDPDGTVFSAQLPVGDRSLQLFGWGLERAVEEGIFLPVSATLLSSPNVAFSIFNGATTTIPFSFETDGQVVTVGSGTLNVNAEIIEIGSACTPLGTDCGEGWWCPPAELIGMPSHCLPSGSVALTEPCGGPTDCVGNASCFDLGDGPRCVQLCLAAGIETACASVEECQSVGADFGVCVPASAE